MGGRHATLGEGGPDKIGAAENAAIARAEMDAVQRGDIEGVMDLYADDVVLEYPGRNVLSGTYTGKDAVRGWFTGMAAAVGPGTKISRTLRDIVASDTHAIQLVSIDASKDGKITHWNSAIALYIRNGKISVVRILIDDPYVVDELLA